MGDMKNIYLFIKDLRQVLNSVALYQVSQEHSQGNLLVTFNPFVSCVYHDNLGLMSYTRPTQPMSSLNDTCVYLYMPYA